MMILDTKIVFQAVMKKKHLLILTEKLSAWGITFSVSNTSFASLLDFLGDVSILQHLFHRTNQPSDLFIFSFALQAHSINLITVFDFATNKSSSCKKV